MKTRRALIFVPALCAALILLAATAAFAPTEGRLLRFPAVSADQIVFSSAGDLYTVPLSRRDRPQAHEPRGLRGLRPVLARRQDASPSPANTTATAKFSSSPPRAARPSA